MVHVQRSIFNSVLSNMLDTLLATAGRRSDRDGSILLSNCEVFSSSDRLETLTNVFTVSVNPSTNMPRFYRKLGFDNFLEITFPCIVY